MHDIVIRGGTIVDGTGAPASTGDVAIDGDRLVQVGGKAGPARREVAAEGRLVTPGWVDVHTHYDGQATWDPVLAPSSWHGATTIVFGNCGVGFAPVRQQHQQALPHPPSARPDPSQAAENCRPETSVPNQPPPQITPIENQLTSVQDQRRVSSVRFSRNTRVTTKAWAGSGN